MVLSAYLVSLLSVFSNPKLKLISSIQLFEVSFRLITQAAWSALINGTKKSVVPDDEIKKARKGIYVNLRMDGDSVSGYKVKLGKGRK